MTETQFYASENEMAILSKTDDGEAEQHVANREQLDNVLVELKELANSNKRGCPRWNQLTGMLYDSVRSLIGWRILKKYNQFVISHRKKSGNNITEDLKNEAWLSIMDNIKKFDPKRGCATNFIVRYTEKGAQEAVYKTTGMSQYYTMTYLQIQKVIDELKFAGIEPTIPAIQTKTGLPVSTIKNTLDTAERLLSRVSYDTNGFEETSLDGKVIVDTPGVAKEVTDDLTRIDVHDAIKSLEGYCDVPSTVVQGIVVSKFIYGDTHNEIAEKYGLPLETVSRVISKKKKELYDRLKKKGYAPSLAKNEKRNDELDDDDNVAYKNDSFIEVMNDTEKNIMIDFSEPDKLAGKPKKVDIVEIMTDKEELSNEDLSVPDVPAPSRKKGKKQ